MRRSSTPCARRRRHSEPIPQPEPPPLSPGAVFLCERDEVRWIGAGLSPTAASVPSMTDDNSLAWFHRLSIDDKVLLLRDPHGKLPERLVVQLGRLGADGPGVLTNAYFPANGGPTGFHVSGSEASRLEAQREQLERWWDHLSGDDRSYLIEHRADELPAEYAALVRQAHLEPVLIVAIVSDNRTGRFRLPPMIDVFVELQARELV